MLVVSVSVSLSDGFGAEFAQLLFYFILFFFLLQGACEKYYLCNEMSTKGICHAWLLYSP